MIGYFNYTVILTYLSLISAVLGSVFSMNGDIKGATICLLFCGAFDSFDGMVARTKKNRSEEEKRFGIQLDSLVDAISFGILPILMSYNLGLDSYLWVAIYALYGISIVNRLGYFNVVEEMRQQETNEKRKHYQGLPVTTVSLILPAIFLCQQFLGVDTMVIIFGIAMIVCMIAFTVNFKIFKPGFKGIMVMVFIGFLILIGILIL